MFADTLTITINSVAKVLTRVNQDGYSSEYLLRETTGDYKLKLRNSSYMDKNRGVTIDRHNVEFTYTIYPVAPSTVSTIRKYYSVLEHDHTDDVVADTNFAVGITGFQTSANFTKLLNWES